MSTTNTVKPMNEDEFRAYAENCEIDELEMYMDVIKGLISKWKDHAAKIMAMHYDITPEELMGYIAKKTKGKAETSNRKNTIHGYKTYQDFKVVPYVDNINKKVSKGALAGFIQNATEEEKEGFKTLNALKNGAIKLEDLIKIDASAVKILKNNEWVNATEEDIKSK
jgi:hypothetical protein